MVLSFLRPLITGNKAREILWYIFPQRPIPLGCLKRNWGAELQDRDPQTLEAPKATAYILSWQDWSHTGSSPKVCVPGGLSCAGPGNQPRHGSSKASRGHWHALHTQDAVGAGSWAQHTTALGLQPVGGSPDFSLWWDLDPDFPSLVLRGCQNQQPGAGRGSDARLILRGMPCHFKHGITSDPFGWRGLSWLSGRWRRWPVGFPPSKAVLRCFDGAKPHVCGRRRTLANWGQALSTWFTDKRSVRAPWPGLR